MPRRPRGCRLREQNGSLDFEPKTENEVYKLALNKYYPSRLQRRTAAKLEEDAIQLLNTENQT